MATGTTSTIPTGLKAGHMRARIEDKARMTSIGGVCAGNTSSTYHDSDSVSGGMYETECIAPSADNLPFCSQGASTMPAYAALNTNAITSSSVSKDKLGNGTIVSPDNVKKTFDITTTNETPSCGVKFTYGGQRIDLLGTDDEIRTGATARTRFKYNNIVCPVLHLDNNKVWCQKCKVSTEIIATDAAKADWYINGTGDKFLEVPSGSSPNANYPQSVSSASDIMTAYYGDTFKYSCSIHSGFNISEAKRTTTFFNNTYTVTNIDLSNNAFSNGIPFEISNKEIKEIKTTLTIEAESCGTCQFVLPNYDNGGGTVTVQRSASQYQGAPEQNISILGTSTSGYYSDVPIFYGDELTVIATRQPGYQVRCRYVWGPNVGEAYIEEIINAPDTSATLIHTVSRSSGPEVQLYITRLQKTVTVTNSGSDSTFKLYCKVGSQTYEILPSNSPWTSPSIDAGTSVRLWGEYPSGYVMDLENSDYTSEANAKVIVIGDDNIIWSPVFVQKASSQTISITNEVKRISQLCSLEIENKIPVPITITGIKNVAGVTQSDIESQGATVSGRRTKTYTHSSVSPITRNYWTCGVYFTRVGENYYIDGVGVALMS